MTDKRKTIMLKKEDLLPRCSECVCGEFEPQETIGDCHLLPMDWVQIDETPTPMWKPAMADGYCRHFERRTN